MYIQILQTDSFDDLKNHLLTADQQHIVLLDVDDTLITSKANVFRYKDHNNQDNKYQKLIDEMKDNKNNLPNYAEIISHWRTKRQSILVHPEWPKLIQQMKKQSKVYALTQMDTGNFGQISSMEAWRFNELMQMEIEFSREFSPESTSGKSSNQNRVLLKDHRGYAVFFEGILMTGPFTKVETLDKLIQEKYRLPQELKQASKQEFRQNLYQESEQENEMRAPKIIFVDDRKEHVQDIGEWARARNIEYLGIIFRGVETIRGNIQDEIVQIQKDYLLNKGIWLEDEEALKILQNSEN